VAVGSLSQGAHAGSSKRRSRSLDVTNATALKHPRRLSNLYARWLHSVTGAITGCSATLFIGVTSATALKSTLTVRQLVAGILGVTGAITGAALL
jgi:hypothetical protein